MKKIVLTLTLIAALAAALVNTGCKTTGGTDTGGTVTNTLPFIYVDSQGLLVVGGFVVSPALVGSSVSTATTLGIVQVVNNNSNSIPYLVMVKQLIDTSINNGNYDPTLLLAALKNSTANGLNDNPALQAVLLAAVNTYATYYSALTAQGLSNVSPYLKPILQGISDGIGAVTAPAVTPVGIMRE
jgi:hypothetical protein